MRGRLVKILPRWFAVGVIGAISPPPGAYVTLMHPHPNPLPEGEGDRCKLSQYSLAADH